jgi:succinoglycan biosynthesis protein ExoM
LETVDQLPPPANRRAIDVAVCTYRRATIAATLASIATQRLPADVVVRVIVADNDAVPSARGRVLAAAAEFGLTVSYVHAPARNISIARNACLDAARAPLLAFIDDDEVATPGWLAALVACLDATGADVVLGPAIADYPADAPAWVRHADLHSTRPPGSGATPIATGYTCNVLMRTATIGGRRFDPALGRSGGEDDVFFAAAVRAGASIAYAPDAVVRDPVPVARARLRWLCRRAFRNGQTYARIRIAGGQASPREFVVAAAKLGYCTSAALVGLLSPVRWRCAVVRGALHAGACARYLGRRDIELY